MLVWGTEPWRASCCEACVFDGTIGIMSGFETRFKAGDDAERIQAAFYGLVSAHADDINGDASLRTEIGNAGRELRIRLWSAEAMDAFLRGLAHPVRRPAYE